MGCGATGAAFPRGSEGLRGGRGLIHFCYSTLLHPSEFRRGSGEARSRVSEEEEEEAEEEEEEEEDGEGFTEEGTPPNQT